MIGKSNVAKARSEVTRLEETVAKWEADAAAKTAELEDLEGRAGDEVLADETVAERLTGAIAKLRAGIEIGRRAADAARRKLYAARRELLRAKAAELREQAETLVKSAEKRQQRTDKLLKELAEFEGVEFEPVRVIATLNPGPGIVPPTRTDMFRNQAAAMKQRARQHDQQAEDATDEALGALVKGLGVEEKPAEAAPVG